MARRRSSLPRIRCSKTLRREWSDGLCGAGREAHRRVNPLAGRLGWAHGIGHCRHQSLRRGRAAALRAGTGQGRHVAGLGRAAEDRPRRRHARRAAFVRCRIRRHSGPPEFDCDRTHGRLFRGKGPDCAGDGTARVAGRQCRDGRHGVDRGARSWLAVAAAHSRRGCPRPSAVRSAQRRRQRRRRHRPHAVVIASALSGDRSASAVAGTPRLPGDARQCLAGGFDLRRRTRHSRLLQSRHRGAHPVAGLRGRHLDRARRRSCPRCQPRRGCAAGACDARRFRRRAARNDRQPHRQGNRLRHRPAAGRLLCGIHGVGRAFAAKARRRCPSSVQPGRGADRLSSVAPSLSADGRPHPAGGRERQRATLPGHEGPRETRRRTCRCRSRGHGGGRPDREHAGAGPGRAQDERPRDACRYQHARRAGGPDPA